MCGENPVAQDNYIVDKGSPPRVRGKHKHGAPRLPLIRITPACAGKTDSESVYLFDAGDHPRVCGENKGDKSLSSKDKGSPPRVRGKRV